MTHQRSNRRLLCPAYCKFCLQRLQEQEHAVLDSVELHLRVPLEKEIPVTAAQETRKKSHQLTDSEDEFPEITEVKKRLKMSAVELGVMAGTFNPAPCKQRQVQLCL